MERAVELARARSYAEAARLVKTVSESADVPSASASVELASLLRSRLADRDSHALLVAFLDLAADSDSSSALTELCLATLRSAAPARVKERCFAPLERLVAASSSSSSRDSLESLAREVGRGLRVRFGDAVAAPPTVLAAEMRLLGELCRRRPELVARDANAVGRLLLRELDERVRGRAKVSFPLVEGCLSALAGHAVHFFDETTKDALYAAVKFFSDPGEQHRRGHARAALRLIAEQAERFETRLFDDYKYWHLLLLKWINRQHAEDKNAGRSALFAFYRSVGSAISSAGPCERTRERLEYFVEYFRRVLAEKLDSESDVSLVSSTYEVKYSLRGFTTLVSECKSFFGDDELRRVANAIAQRATLLYRDSRSDDASVNKEATEESTEKIEELCNHVEALGAIGINADHNLESLVCILIADYPKCKPHRRFILVAALRRALQIVDSKIITSRMIEESCKYCISSDLYYDETENNDPLLSYRTFVPLWKSLIEMSSPVCRVIFNEFVDYVLKILPTLDISTRFVNRNSEEQNPIDDSETFTLDAFEIPRDFQDYRFFHNICDLTATILLMESSHDYFDDQIESYLRMLIEGRKTYPKALGYLRVAEAVLATLKKNPDLSMDADVHKYVCQLLNDISMQDCGEAFQLRSALALLQAPPRILNDALLEKGSAAFKIVFRMGKSNLKLVSRAVEILENWNEEIEKQMFRTLCNEILPDLNEYLISSGISDVHVIEKNSENNYERNKEKTSPQLASLQNQIILFMGKMDSEMVNQLLTLPTTDDDDDKEDEEMFSIYSVEKLKISLSRFQSQKFEIYLDLLFPRIKELALTSTNRDTRLTACQALHSFVLIVYGTQVTLPPSQKAHLSNMQIEMFSAMIGLAADADTYISNMFSPLLKQSCNWFANPRRSDENDVGHFITALLNGASHPSNGLVRDVSCRTLNAFLECTVEKSRRKHLAEVPPNLSRVLRAVSHMLSHPHDAKSRGGYFVLNSGAEQLYKVDSGVDKYLLELLHASVKGVRKNPLHNDAPRLEAIENILKCLQYKHYLFEKTNPNRRVPPDFGSGTLPDICEWLLKQGLNPMRKITESCFSTFSNIYGKMNPTAKKNIFRDECEYFLLEGGIGDNFNVTAQKLRYSIENYSFVLKNNTIFEEYFKRESKFKKLLNRIKDFIEKTNDLTVDGLLQLIHGESSDNFEKFTNENNVFKTLWKVYEVILLFSSSKIVILKSFADEISDNFTISVTRWLSNVRSISIMKNDSEFIPKRDINMLITDIKSLMSNKWTNFEDRLLELLNDHPSMKLFSNMTVENGVLTDPLDVLAIVLQLIDVTKRRKLLQKYLPTDVLQNIFDAIFATTENKSPGENRLGKMINFILRLDNSHTKQLILLISDETSILETNLRWIQKDHVTCGAYFYEKFQIPTTIYIRNNSKEFFDVTYDCISQSNVNHHIKLIQTILKVCLERSSVINENKDFSKNVSDFVNKLWSKLLAWNVPFDDLVKLFSLAVAIPSDERMESTENNIGVWLLDCLCDENVTLKNKTTIVSLLPYILKAGNQMWWYDDRLRMGLECLRGLLPLSCHEIKPYTKEQSDYVNVVRALLKSTANSGSYILFEFVVQSTFADANHVCEEDISHQIRVFFEQMAFQDQMDILKELFKLKSTISDNRSLLNLTNRFLLPILSQVSPAILGDFLSENIFCLFQMADNKIVLNASKFQTDRILVEWIIFYKIMEIMFSKLPFEDIDSTESKIAFGLYKDKPSKDQQFIRDIGLRAVKMRTIEIPLEKRSDCTAELLRLSHCAAYKCIYALTVARPGSGAKSYSTLINDTTCRMWEGMIDATRRYSFPLYANRDVRTKNHSIATNKKSGLVGFSYVDQLLTFGPQSVDKRQQLLSQTLRNDILKYDLNAAIIRGGSQDYFNISNTSNNMQVSWTLEDDDLNNHECMATVCQLLRELSDFSQAAEDDSPLWVKCMVNILSDKSRSDNVRLFFSRVVDNADTIFKKYAKELLLPLLMVVQDRCTNFERNINYQDFYILSLLLSWSDTAVPTSPDEKRSASAVLLFLVEELYKDPNHRSFELLSTVLVKWGIDCLSPPYEYLMAKLATRKDLAVSIKIMNAFMTANVPFWTDGHYSTLEEHLMHILKSPDKTIYNPGSETVGLVMKLRGDDPGCLGSKVKEILDGCYREGNHEKIVLCLDNVQKHCSQIGDESLITKVSYLFPRFPANYKKMCLDIFDNSLHALSNEFLYCELNAWKIDEHVQNKTLQISALNIMNKCLSILRSDQTNKSFNDISFVKSTESHCREIVYDILMKLFDSYEQQINDSHDAIQTPDASSNETRKRRLDDGQNCNLTCEGIDANLIEKLVQVKLSLLCGLDDVELSIKEKVAKFLNEKYAQDNIRERWINVCRDFMSDGLCKRATILGQIVRLIFSHWTLDPDFKIIKCFENPLEECTYEVYDWKVARRSQSGVSNPLFAETLNSQLLMSSIIQQSQRGKVINNKDIETLQTLLNSKNSTRPQDLLLRNSIQTFNDTFIRENSSYYNPTDSNSNMTSGKLKSDTLRRRMVESKTQKIIKFSGIAIGKRHFERMKNLKAKPFESYRNFRDGEYPDVQISLADVFLPLMELIARDVLLARQLFSLLFASLLSCSSLDSEVRLRTPPRSAGGFPALAFSLATKHLDAHVRSGLETPLALSLLEVCRMTLAQHDRVEGFESVMNAVAKCGGDVQWLTALILEERQLKHARRGLVKRQKLCANLDVYFDDIHKFSTAGNYRELQKLYAEASVDGSVSNDMRIAYTESYFDGFAQLSDWDGFVEQMSFQFSSDRFDSFDYNKLWSKTWMKNSLLSLTFHACIHRMSFCDEESIADELLKFQNAVNEWIADAEKSQYMNSHLPIPLALWRTLYGNEPRLHFLTPTVEWIRNKWMEMFINRKNFRRNEVRTTLGNLQMIGEFCTVLGTPIFATSNLTSEQFNKSLNRVANIWKCCNPTTVGDELALWDLRLACRNVLSKKLQNITSNFFDEESENNDISFIGRIQRTSELQLVKAAVAKCNYAFAEKFVKKHANDLESSEILPWNIQYAKIQKLKAVNQLEENKKIQALLKAWKISESTRSTFSSADHPMEYIELLTNSSGLSFDIANILNSNENLKESNTLKSIDDIFEMNNFNRSNADVNSLLFKYSKKHLEESIRIAEESLLNDRVPTLSLAEFMASVHLTMAKFCRNVNENPALKQELRVTPNLIKSLLNAMSYGSVEACKMFPVLLMELENRSNESDIFDVFRSSVTNVPTWSFLPWISQLLAHLPHLKELLLDLVTEIASDYPQSMIHQYRLSKRMWSKENGGSAMGEVIEMLDGKLLDSNIETLVKAISSVCDPNILLKTHLENVAKASEKSDEHFCEAFAALFEEVFPNDGTRGPIFNTIRSFKSSLEIIWKKYKDTKNTAQAKTELLDFLKEQNLEQRESFKKYRSINDFSPFLSRFDSLSAQHPIEIFGQYSKFQAAKPSRKVFVAKFETEVTIIASLRRPARITAIGSDGRKYSFLVKRGEDLRQDERIQQCFCLINDSLVVDSAKIVTYKVVPLTWDCGVIEWLNNYATLKDVICQYESNIESLLMKLRLQNRDYVLSTVGSTFREKYANMIGNIDRTVSMYSEIVDRVPQFLFRDALFKLAITADKFVHVRNNLVHSLASMSISQWILGIGDRHLSNALLCLKSGKLVGIDFGHAFGSATQLLEVPELLPFRLTPQLSNAMAPNLHAGKLRRSMIQTLENLRENSDVLLAAMEVFIYESTLSWMDDEGEGRLPGSTERRSSRAKVNQCKRKLSGVVPSKITVEDLDAATNQQFKESFQNLLNKCCDISKFSNVKSLNTAQQVDCLLQQATSEQLLAVSYFGWEPWV